MYGRPWPPELVKKVVATPQLLRAPRLSLSALNAPVEAADTAKRLYDATIPEGWTREQFKALLDASQTRVEEHRSIGCLLRAHTWADISAEVGCGALECAGLWRDLACRVSQAEKARGRVKALAWDGQNNRLTGPEEAREQVDGDRLPKKARWFSNPHRVQVWAILCVRPQADLNYPLSLRPPPASAADSKSRAWSEQEQLRLIWHVKEYIVPGSGILRELLGGMRQS